MNAILKEKLREGARTLRHAIANELGEALPKERVRKAERPPAG